MSRIDSLQTFVSVVRSRNFTSAADSLGVTPSAVSKQISGLEERLGVRLLNRTTRSVSPTEAGQMFYQHCENILESITEAEKLVTDFDVTPRGRLRITAMSNFGRRELARMFTDFSQKYPDISFDLHISDRPLDIVKEGYDFALRLGSLEDSRLIAKPVAEQNIVICASKEYLERWGTPEKLEDLNNHRILIVANAEYARINWLRQFEKDHGFSLSSVERKLAVNDIDLVYEACLAGMGITALPTYIAERHLEVGELVRLFPEVDIPVRSIKVVFPQNRYLANKSRAFLDFITAYFDDPSQSN
ncbi:MULTISPECIES: LysR family transcriptional regulator [Oceanospirillaceae]|jgi:LysR family transcriptional regulator, regulator for bpeEF and oprC|uniref:LysR family transcriptional regulator n=1 Tax=Oceanospirillaceae TaxID=135620 RepID=UPI001191D1A6|nr:MULTISPECIES: LysR family transcriptional regulator [Thalassolituus]MCA6058266.1 LysR family transcriptional regulator [Thalassolituus sp. ST750PaO-4]MCB2386664.1 LysR family transcriptional regulator [Thalassolituus alkanivorans]MCB2424158.1 LysR family transcriptional regulator [Thalassolituus alkanivorans]TVV42263.1 LysR family transcriptional regulator [Thalassolituus sp. C2-1]